VANANQASLGYLLLATQPDGPRPGPLEHNKVWIRDAAFIGEALLGAGRLSLVEQYLPRLFQYQENDGRIPAILTPDGPELEREWDSQGQAIYLVALAYRYNRSRVFLERWEPNVRRAAEFIRTLRARTADNPSSSRGILPPSRSAEDLGSDKWHHYWDSYWGVAGLEEAAFIEAELGYADQSSWMMAEAQALRQAIRTSITAVMGEYPRYIPGSPEDLDSSAMARGNSVALYPVQVLSPDDPLVIRSFDYYYQKWIAPSRGGYTHIWGQWWPYGGLGLARDYLRLGRQDIVHEILAWTLLHQTLPGAYAWAEQVSPVHGGITGGDMPHAWAAASFVSLIREMLAMSVGDRLVLFAGVPPSWLQKGNTVGLREAITEYGTLTALVESDLETGSGAWQGSLTLRISGTARPPGGYVWQLPGKPHRITGPLGAVVKGGLLTIPPDGGTIRLEYENNSGNR
jgi:hypothetical protein